MNLQKLLQMQEQLDNHIIAKQKINFIKLTSLALALSTELSEVANAFQKWKYWKVNSQPKPGLLEEVADVLHFLLSATYRFQLKEESIKKLGAIKYPSVEQQFLQMQYTTCMVGTFGGATDKQNYIKILWSLFKGMLEHLDISEEQVYAAYLLKNKENYERQKVGY